MTPKEKAEQLYESMFYKLNDSKGIFLQIDSKDECAKNCAILAVDEILAIFYDDTQSMWDDELSYWHQVKQEIEKL